MDLGNDKTRIAMVQFGGTSQTEFNFSGDKNTVVTKIMSMAYLSTGTATGDALNYVNANFADEFRSDAKPVIVVLTDGKSMLGVPVAGAAEDLRNSIPDGVIYTIGVGAPDQTELEEISSDPDNYYMYIDTDWASLAAIRKEVTRKFCSSRPETIYEKCKKKEIDVSFLIDSSGSVPEADFLKMKDFVKSVINPIDVQAPYGVVFLKCHILG